MSKDIERFGLVKIKTSDLVRLVLAYRGTKSTDYDKARDAYIRQNTLEEKSIGWWRFKFVTRRAVSESRAREFWFKGNPSNGPYCQIPHKVYRDRGSYWLEAGEAAISAAEAARSTTVYIPVALADALRRGSGV